VDNTPGDKLGVWRDMRLADALVYCFIVCMCVLMCDFVSYFVCVIVYFVFLCDILLPSGVINDDDDMLNFVRTMHMC